MVVLVASLEDPLGPARPEIASSLNNANDLDADATSYGYSRPWRYGWSSGGGWRNGWGGGYGGWGWGGRGWGWGARG
ncbi:hypothetical protein WN48_03129 [Eufriesea mexicana]|nr:hypothetical protein WN48_03129 [Eufriesea mexicana]